MMSFSYIWYTEILMLNTSVKFQLVNIEVFHYCYVAILNSESEQLYL